MRKVTGADDRYSLLSSPKGQVFEIAILAGCPRVFRMDVEVSVETHVGFVSAAQKGAGKSRGPPWLDTPGSDQVFSAKQLRIYIINQAPYSRRTFSAGT